MNELIDTSLYAEVKDILETARNHVYSAANSAMVRAYWSIGKLLYEAGGENERSAYGIEPDGKQMFASKYQFALPTAEELERYIRDQCRLYEEREDLL